jgi:hypothetical protein
VNHIHAADHPVATSPFGAAHRVYLDTPPLKGLRLQPRWFHLEPHRKEKGCMFYATNAVPDGTVLDIPNWR